MIKFMGIIPALLLMATPAFADITVRGVGSVSAAPDMAIIRVGVQTKDMNATKALKENSTRMNALFTAILGNDKFKLVKANLQTSQFSIQPAWLYDNNIRVFEGYTVTNSLTIKVCDLNVIGNIIKTVVEHGGNAARINGITFTIEDRTALEIKARKKAVLDAMAKAKQLAETAGTHVGSLKSISETSSWQWPRIPYNSSRHVGDERSPPIAAGEQTVSITVNAVFKIY